jgi:hypothetical protein
VGRLDPAFNVAYPFSSVGFGSSFTLRAATPARYAPLVSALKAHVKNGQIVLDEPSELPEGMAAHVYLYNPEGDSLSDAQREKLHRALDRSLAQADAGQGVPAEEVLAELERDS